jgi:hypothetical protein
LRLTTASGLCRSRKLDKITVCQPKELSLSSGDRLQLKANAQSQDGRRLANGELVTVKQIHADGRIALDDGRTLPKNYRQFVRGYAVTSYAAQGKTVDYVLFSDSAVKAATNEQQWYVTISRGRKGVKIFTADKGQLRENISRGGARTLALDMKPSAFQKLAKFGGATWLSFSMFKRRSALQKRAAEIAQHEKLEREAEALRQAEAAKQSQAVKPTESVKPPRSRLKRSSRQFKNPKPSGGGLKFNQFKTSKRVEA